MKKLINQRNLYEYIINEKIEYYDTLEKAMEFSEDENKYFGVFAYGVTELMPSFDEENTKTNNTYFYDDYKIIPFVFKKINDSVFQDVGSKKIFSLGTNYQDGKTIDEISEAVYIEIPLLGIDKDLIFKIDGKTAFFPLNDNFKNLYGQMMFEDGRKIQDFLDKLEAEAHYDFTKKVFLLKLNQNNDSLIESNEQSNKEKVYEQR